MTSLFKKLVQPAPETVHYDEWGGQFSCRQIGCDGWSNIAKYIPSERILSWMCQYGHISVIEDIGE